MKKILNYEQENWLYANYPDKTNKELAEELTRMIRSENQKQLKKLEGILKGVTDVEVKKIIEKKISDIIIFRGVSSDFVKKQAQKLKCPPKSVAHMSETARKKAEKTNIKILMAKASLVESPIEWFRTFVLYDSKVCVVKDDKEMNSIRAAMSRWNRYEGYNKGIFLESSYLRTARILKVKAIINRAIGI